jgi:hypothetical protein
MERAFGPFPCTVGPAQVEMLRGMAMMYKGSDDDNPYLELIEIIDKQGTVQLHASY